MNSTTRWFAGINTVLGLWLIVVPFLYSPPTGALYSALAVGALVAIVAGYNAYLLGQGDSTSVPGSAFVALLGLYVIVAPFLFEVPTWVTWNDVIVGALIAILAGYNAYTAVQSSGQSAAQPA